jgi:hypothetical protein
MTNLTRRQFLVSTLPLCAAVCASSANGAEEAAEPIIDIHQHTNYRDRENAVLLAHQRAMGVPRESP